MKAVLAILLMFGSFSVLANEANDKTDVQEFLRVVQEDGNKELIVFALPMDTMTEHPDFGVFATVVSFSRDVLTGKGSGMLTAWVKGQARGFEYLFNNCVENKNNGKQFVCVGEDEKQIVFSLDRRSFVAFIDLKTSGIKLRQTSLVLAKHESCEKGGSDCLSEYTVTKKDLRKSSRLRLMSEEKVRGLIEQEYFKIKK